MALTRVPRGGGCGLSRPRSRGVSSPRIYTRSPNEVRLLLPRAAEGGRLRGPVAQGVSEHLCADGEEAPDHPSFSRRGSSTY